MEIIENPGPRTDYYNYYVYNDQTESSWNFSEPHMVKSTEI